MMIKLLKSKKGSSSVLVILLMVVLVVFGIAALTTALSGMRLGQKAAVYTDTCYAAEAVASERFADIDKAVTDTGGNPEAVKIALSSLNFDTQVTVDGTIVAITFKTQQDNIWIHTKLCMTDGDSGSLHVTEWIQTTQDD